MLILSLSASAADLEAAALLAVYDTIRAPLVEDRIDLARAAAATLAANPAARADVATAATRVSAAPDAAAARIAFGELSRIVVLDFADAGGPEGMKVYHCPMTSAYGYWLQPRSGIANPYMGRSMPTCGEGTSLKAAARAAEGMP